MSELTEEELEILIGRPPEGDSKVEPEQDWFPLKQAVEEHAATHPLSGTKMTPEEMYGHYKAYAIELAKATDCMVSEAEFAEVDANVITCAFINQLIELNPDRWALFAKNLSRTN